MPPIIRSVLSVLGAFFVVALLVGLSTGLAAQLMLGSTGPEAESTTPFLVVNLTYSVLFAIVGGFVAATVSDRSPLRHAAALSVVHDADRADLMDDQQRPAGARRARLVSVGDHFARSADRRSGRHPGYAVNPIA
jgi:hypothetical protein